VVEMTAAAFFRLLQEAEGVLSVVIPGEIIFVGL
jgi:hypothetical protein